MYIQVRRTVLIGGNIQTVLRQILDMIIVMLMSDDEVIVSLGLERPKKPT
jgi:hypothetical protein